MVRLQDDLERMTLNSYDFLAGQSIHQDARGQKLGNTPAEPRWCMWTAHSWMNWKLISA